MIYDILEEECQEKGEPWFYDYQDVAARFTVYESMKDYLEHKDLDIAHEIVCDYGLFNFLVENVDDSVLDTFDWVAFLKRIKVDDEHSSNFADYLGRELVGYINSRAYDDWGESDKIRFIAAQQVIRVYDETNNLEELCKGAGTLGLRYGSPLALIDIALESKLDGVIDEDSLEEAICTLPGSDDFMDFIKDTPNFWDDFRNDHVSVFSRIVNPDDDWDLLIDEDRA